MCKGSSLEYTWWVECPVFVASRDNCNKSNGHNGYECFNSHCAWSNSQMYESITLSINNKDCRKACISISDWK